MNNNKTKKNNKNEEDMKEFLQVIISQIYLINKIDKTQIKIEEDIDEIILSLDGKFQIKHKTRKRKTISKDEMCMGRKMDLKQCSRHRQEGSEFCKSHSRNLPKGRIDEDVPPPKVKAKRGRKRKIIFDERMFNKDKLTTFAIVINDKKYLSDIKGNIFTFDKNKPQYLGIKTIDNKIVLPSEL